MFAQSMSNAKSSFVPTFLGFISSFSVIVKVYVSCLLFLGGYETGEVLGTRAAIYINPATTSCATSLCSV